MRYDSTGDKPDFVVLELGYLGQLFLYLFSAGRRPTLDILIDASRASLIETEKLFVCCPIWTDVPCAGAYISFVIARMFPQLSMRASAALVGAWTIIYKYVGQKEKRANR